MNKEVESFIKLLKSMSRSDRDKALDAITDTFCPHCYNMNCDGWCNYDSWVEI